MPTNYEPKNAPLGPNRVQKIAKDLIREASDDRKLALEAYAYFKAIVDENPNDGTAKALMVDALKVAQSSKNNVVKVLTLVVKMEESKGSNTGSTKASPKGGPAKTTFSEIEEYLNDQK